MLTVEFIKLSPQAICPRNAYQESAGWDLYVLEEVTIRPGRHVDVRTGIAIALPKGHFARIVGRSSAFRKRGLLVTEGIIDEGFRGELFSSVYNWTHLTQWLKPGESVAQVIIQEVIPVEWQEAEQLPTSVRGTRGFGSSDEVAV